MKKQIIFVAAVMFGLMSCGNNDAKTDASHDHETHSHEGHDHDGHDHEGHDHAVAGEANSGPMDPVCKMTKTDDWTEFTTNGSDTVWFCSPLCKEQYDADPSKFAVK